MTDQVFKYLIIGRGMMGAAAARHLALQTDGVALVGPDEPADKQSHEGVFASHYDEARITRTIDGDPVWAKLAHASIARYSEIEQQSGIRFYHEAGCLIVGTSPDGHSDYVDKAARAAEGLGISTQSFDHAGLAEHFGYFRFEPVSIGIYEAHHAGYVNPRRLVEAQSLLAARAGASLINDVVIGIRDEGGHAVVTTAGGKALKAEKLLVATGGFSIADTLLPRRIDLSVYARTVTFFEIADQDLPAYHGMPSLIHEPSNPRDHIYLLPPVRYPDGKTYLKIGGDPDDVRLKTEPEIRAWFRGGGRESARDHLALICRSLVPGVAQAPVSMAPCVTSFTGSGYPAIGFSDSPRIAVLTGGCGAAAKSSDEIGRLGAEFILRGTIAHEGYDADFTPVFV
ncbi:FAD-dependent oxidoreductase [Agrobacterium vitis]|uniref:FAD-dependent oxidoreductase n=1 Tax=Agrobacterium vitis TaxID=373 RepID=A0ABD6GII1_AGRVI|nr:FAD-binding oxidoreductase [Agrobacterium vitis]MUO81955.1 FAD-dependent oxidoreductase [Agrobacterium vitis]MUO97032.1 FAD-dependent oxidoreductase [Agrobacterium vitis]MUP08103.1 FAD-dependent oxidoreductase [Agrobacterium vitis]MUZ80641.1 FAD-dependent oxidoreductase [Agrobacterium vitis]MVA09223.1 FAD-dependent oxidoreductase [Agrobacterium vitis]